MTTRQTITCLSCGASLTTVTDGCGCDEDERTLLVAEYFTRGGGAATTTPDATDAAVPPQSSPDGKRTADAK